MDLDRNLQLQKFSFKEAIFFTHQVFDKIPWGLCRAGKESLEGTEGSGETSGHIPGAASEEAGRRDSEVYAGAAPSSGQSESKICD